MKKILSILLVLVTVTGSVMATEVNPNASTGMAVMKIQNGFKLFYKGTKVQNVTVSIINEEGRVVFTQKIKNIDSFARRYNLNSLPFGEYTIELASAEGKLLEKVKYTNTVVAPSVGKMNLISLTNAPSKYVLTVPNTGTTDISVKIFSADNKLMFEGTEQITGNYAKLFDLQAVGSNFRMEVTDRSGKVQILTPRI
jgi:hypothetical protein